MRPFSLVREKSALLGNFGTPRRPVDFVPFFFLSKRRNKSINPVVAASDLANGRQAVGRLHSAVPKLPSGTDFSRTSEKGRRLAYWE